MSKLIYDHDSLPTFASLRSHPVFRQRPTYVGQPIVDWPGSREPHTLQIAVVLPNHVLPTRLSRSELIQGLGNGPTELAILMGHDFHQNWALLFGTIADFDKTGVLVLERAGVVERPQLGVVAGPTLLSTHRRGAGDSSYAPIVRKALAVVGAQLYLCQMLGRGAQQTQPGKIDADPIVEHLTRRLLPLRQHVRRGQTAVELADAEERRYVDGRIGADDPLYRRLISDGTTLVRTVYGDLHEKTVVGRRWEKLGKKLTQLADDSGSAVIIPGRGAETLDVAVQLACAAFQRDGVIRSFCQNQETNPEAPGMLRNLTVGERSGSTLVQEVTARVSPHDIFGLTRLAWLWDFDPVEIHAGLFPWQLHFSAARFLGRLYLGHAGEITLPLAADWGLRALRMDVLDPMLDAESAAARAWLRQFMNFGADLWDRLPPALPQITGDNVIWNFRQDRRRRANPNAK